MPTNEGHNPCRGRGGRRCLGSLAGSRSREREHTLCGPRAAHLRRFLSTRTTGRHSRVLCGPGDGFGACAAGARAGRSRGSPRGARGLGGAASARTRRRPGGLANGAHEDAAQLVQHPVLGRIEPLQVLLDPARHGGARVAPVCLRAPREPEIAGKGAASAARRSSLGLAGDAWLVPRPASARPSAAAGGLVTTLRACGHRPTPLLGRARASDVVAQGSLNARNYMARFGPFALSLSTGLAVAENPAIS